MKGKGLISILGAAAFALALTSTASAQLKGNVCQVGSTGANGNGTAIIANPGLNGSGPQLLPFAFSNSCSGTATQGCAVGFLANATCAENTHSGDFMYCPKSSCSLSCNNGPCTPGNVPSAVLIAGGPDCYKGTFMGLCVGNLCVGSTTVDVAYALLFSQATSQAALAQCPAKPVGAGGSLTSASFSGLIVY